MLESCEAPPGEGKLTHPNRGGFPRCTTTIQTPSDPNHYHRWHEYTHQMEWSRRRALACGIAVATAGCVDLGGATRGDWPSTEWPTVGYDERNRGAVGDGSAPRDLSADWAVDVGRGPWTSPVAAAGTVYVANRDRLRAITLETGAVASFEFEATVSGTPAIDDGGAFVPTTSGDGGALVRVGPDGEVEWRLSLPGGRPYAVAVDEDSVAVRTRAATALVDRATADVAWTREESAYEPHGRHRFVDLSPAISDDGVVVPGPDGVRCRDHATGEERWHDPRGRVASSPAVDGGTVYAAAVDEGIVALDLVTGEEEWSVDASGCWTSPAVGAEAAYATAGFAVLAVDRETGDVGWRFDDDQGLRGDSYANPILAGDALVAGSIGRSVTVLAASDGEVRAAVDGEGTQVSSAVAGGRLLVLDGQTLRAYVPA